MRTIAIVNQKGGCGKTTSAVSLAAVFARRGLRTLLVDLDPQSHCALGLGVPLEEIRIGVADALTDPIEAGAETQYTWSVSRKLDLLPSTVSLAGLEAPDGPFATLPDRDTRLATVLDRYSSTHDLCLVDCPPTLSLLTYSVLGCTREVLVPVETSYFAYRGAKMQWQAIRSVIDRIRRPIAVHMVPTLHRTDSRVANDILSELKREFAELILPIEIRFHDELREAAAIGMPITEYAPSSEARHDYEQLADWLDDHQTRHAEVSVSRSPYATSPGRAAGAPAAPGVRGDRVLDMIARLEGLRSAAETAREAPAHDAPAPSAAPAEPLMTSVPATDGPRADVPGRDADDRASNGVDRPGVEAPGRSRDDAGGPFDASDRAPRIGRASEVQPHRAPYRVSVDGQDAVEVIAAEADPNELGVAAGAIVTSRGVLFAQPAEIGHEVAVAGDFNGWSPTRHRLDLNPGTGVLEILVPLPAGQHRYRLVVDGRWEADRHNQHRVTNPEGEAHSVVEVPPHAGIPG